MTKTSYVALLRGINVGGKNPVPMKDLRAVFEADGFSDVRTYIQSGNVLFATDERASQLESAIEASLEKRFGVPLVVVVRSHRQLRSIVAKAPPGFGETPELHHCDVAFLKSPLTGRQGLEAFGNIREGVDRAWAGTGVVYFERLSAKRTQSRMGRVTTTPEYQQMTIRSWATTTKLLALLDGDRDRGSEPVRLRDADELPQGGVDG